MRISQLANEAGVTTDLLRYLERKGFVEPQMLKLEKRSVRDYSEEQIIVVKTIAKHIRAGFKHDVAYQKALEEISQPRLI